MFYKITKRGKNIMFVKINLLGKDILQKLILGFGAQKYFVDTLSHKQTNQNDINICFGPKQRKYNSSLSFSFPFPNEMMSFRISSLGKRAPTAVHWVEIVPTKTSTSKIHIYQ